MLLALQYCHTMGQYGTSLTPQNVLVTRWWLQHNMIAEQHPGFQASSGGFEGGDLAPVVVLAGFNYVTKRHNNIGDVAAQVMLMACIEV